MSLGRSVSAASMLGPTKVTIPINLTDIKMIIMLLVEQVVRRVDRPRPLKLSAANRLSALELSSVEDVVVRSRRSSQERDVMLRSEDGICAFLEDENCGRAGGGLTIYGGHHGSVSSLCTRRRFVDRTHVT